jgi:hypothetical protein
VADVSGELGAWVALSFAYPINQWLTVNGTLTLVGDFGMLINTGRFTNSGAAPPSHSTPDTDACSVTHSPLVPTMQQLSLCLPADSSFRRATCTLMAETVHLTTTRECVCGAAHVRACDVAGATSPARYGGFGVSVQGTWKQTGNLRVEAVGDTSLSGSSHSHPLPCTTCSTTPRHESSCNW